MNQVMPSAAGDPPAGVPAGRGAGVGANSPAGNDVTAVRSITGSPAPAGVNAPEPRPTAGADDDTDGADSEAEDDVRAASDAPVEERSRTGASEGTDGLLDDAGSRTVTTFEHVLHRTFRIFPRTLSSAMEYLV
jgi:hypothetical protein